MRLSPLLRYFTPESWTLARLRRPAVTVAATVRLDVVKQTVTQISTQPPSPNPRARARAGTRARIFFSAFAIACAAGLAYTFLQPAVYVSTAALKIDPPKPLTIQDSPTGTAATPQTTAGPGGAPDGNLSYVLTEMQRLSGGPVMAGVLSRLDPATARGLSAQRLRDALQAAPVPDTTVVRLTARGHDPKVLPALLDAWIASYMDLWGKADDHSASQNLTSLQDQVARLKDQVDRKRADLDDFRQRNGIVSMESDDNEALAKLKGLNLSLSQARDAQAQAEATLQAMQQGIAAGEPVVLSDDKQTIAAMEQHATDLREQLADRASGFTPQYMALDQKYQSLKSSLVRLEKQIAQKRRDSQAAALDQAQQAAASARDTVARLVQQQQEVKQNAAEFTARFNQQQALQGELDRLQALYNAAQDRLVTMQAAGREAQPQVSVLDRPAPPGGPVAPDYQRDAAISVGAAVLFGLLTVWFVEFLNRSGHREPAAYPIMEPRIQIAHFPPAPALGAAQAPAQARLAAPEAPPPRELSPAETAQLLEAATGQARVVVAALASGLCLTDLAGLTWDAVADDGSLALSDGRRYLMRPPLRQLMAQYRAAAPFDPRSAILHDPKGEGLTAADLQGLLVCAAHDAGIASPADVDDQALRHTYIAYLVRQGLRLGDLAAVAGHIPPSQLAAYGRLSPPGRGKPLDEVDVELPALRGVIV